MNEVSCEYNEGFAHGLAVAFLIVTLTSVVVGMPLLDAVYQHGKHVGKLEAAVPELAAEKESSK